MSPKILICCTAFLGLFLGGCHTSRETDFPATGPVWIAVDLHPAHSLDQARALVQERLGREGFTTNEQSREEGHILTDWCSSDVGGCTYRTKILAKFHESARRLDLIAEIELKSGEAWIPVERTAQLQALLHDITRLVGR